MTELASWKTVMGPLGVNEAGVALWKATITMADTSGSFTPPLRDTMAGTVIAAWLDPGTLTASATIKGYSVTDGRATPDYFIDYTVPNPAVEAEILAKRVPFVGNIQIDVASATAADTFTIYVLVSNYADSLSGEGFSDLSAAIAAALAAGSDVPVAVAVAAYGDTASITRPDNTTAYTAGDVIGAATDATAALTFTVGPTGGGEVMITSASIEVDATAVPSGMGNMRLHLYNVTPPSALADNAAWDLPSGDRASYLGYVDIGTPIDVGSTLFVQADGINKQITLASANLYGYLQTIGAYTPTSACVKSLTLHTLRV